MSSARRTFVVSVREQDGPATIQEVRTGRAVRLGSVGEVAEQIERWLRDAKPGGREQSESEADTNAGMPAETD